MDSYPGRLTRTNTRIWALRNLTAESQDGAGLGLRGGGARTLSAVLDLRERYPDNTSTVGGDRGEILAPRRQNADGHFVCSRKI